MAFLDINNVRIAGISACVPSNISENKELSLLSKDEILKYIEITGVERKHWVKHDGSVCTSNGAVAQLTKALSNEWAGQGINVNAIAPGYMDTPLNTKLRAIPERDAEITARIPAHRWGLPEDLMGTIIYLCSRASDYVCGTVIPVDGGYLGR